MKISVIMPSYLGEYEGCASGRSYKFMRAIDSFLQQSYNQKELIVVSDGCAETSKLIAPYFSGHFDQKLIKYAWIEKQPKFSGNVRQAGLDIVAGNIITYLDSDDMFKESDHLTKIVEGFDEKTDWVYFNDYIKFFGIDTLPVEQRVAKISKGEIGTSNIAHKNYKDIAWGGCDGYGHDFTFIKNLEQKYPNYKKITGPSYLVCHIPNQVDN